MTERPAAGGLHECLRGFPGAVVELTSDGVVADSNGRLETLVGRDVVGGPFGELLDPTSQTKWSRLLSHDPSSPDGTLWELTLEHEGGFDLRTFAVVWAPGEPSPRLWLLEYVRDVRLAPLYEEIAAANSELVRTQRALAKESARLVHALAVQEAAVHLRDDVLAIVAHDLRNPLDRMSASLELLLDDSLDAARQPALLAVMQRTVAGMNRLVRDLLDAASIDTGRLALDRKRVEVESLLDILCETYAAQVSAKQLRMECRARDSQAIHADQGRVMQLLGNLVGNAIRLTPAGGEIRVEAERVGEMMRFSVSDTGPGISPYDLALVFERFWQGRREARGGAGLGLAIARGIVEGHGGTIWVESDFGRGTTFHFTLPISEHASDEVTAHR